jgi:hypothetical protein
VSSRARRPTVHFALLGAIVLVALALRLWGIGWGLHDATISRRPHPDEWTIYYLSQWFSAGHNLNPCPHPRSGPGGQCFFDWGMAFPYVAYLVHQLLSPLQSLLPAHLFGRQAQDQFVYIVLAGRLVSAAASTATVLVAYRLARVAFGPAAALLAGLLVALSALLIQLAHFATPDSVTGLLLSLALLGALDASLAPSLRGYLVAGALAGAAMSSEIHMGLLLVPLVTSWVLGGRRVVLWLVAAGVAAALVFLIVNVYALIEIRWYVTAFEHTLRIRTVDSGIQYQDRWAPYQPSWLFVIRFPLGYGVGFAFAAWMVLGAAWSVFRRTRTDWILLAWIVPYFLLVTAEPAKFMRYSAPLLVPLAVLAGRFVVDLWSMRQAWQRVAIAAVAALAVAFTTTYDLAYAGLFSSPDPRLVASSWIAAHSSGTTYVGYEELPDGLINLAWYLPGRARPCITQFHPARLRGVDFVVLDGYTREEVPSSDFPAMARFQSVLRTNSAFQLAEYVHYVPTFFGLRFPIDGAPHDWRYTEHVITVYQHEPGYQQVTRYCFNSIGQAAAALYVPPGKR